MIEVSAPGKLYIAGEYAVVEVGHPAIIVAVDQFITVTINQAVGTKGISFRNRYRRLPYNQKNRLHKYQKRRDIY